MGFEYGFVQQCMHLAVLARNLAIHIATREPDAVLLEGVADSVVGFASNGELAFTRIRGALHSHHKLRIGLELGVAAGRPSRQSQRPPMRVKSAACCATRHRLPGW